MGVAERDESGPFVAASGTSATGAPVTVCLPVDLIRGSLALQLFVLSAPVGSGRARVLRNDGDGRSSVCKSARIDRLIDRGSAFLGD